MPKIAKSHALPQAHRGQLAAISRKVALARVPVDGLRPPDRAVRKHPRSQRLALEASIRQRGFIVPILATADNVIVDGVLRLEIAKAVGMATVPIVRVDRVSRSERRFLSIALNRIPDMAIWDEAVLTLEFKDLLRAVDLEFSIEASGFSTGHIDVLFEAAADTAEEEVEPSPLDPGLPVVSRLGDLWLIGTQHRLMCANARDPLAYEALLCGQRARVICTDPPYNVRIGGNVSGLGRHRHREFVEASGEMSASEYQAFLQETLQAMTGVVVDGGVVFTAIDWRHIGDLLTAGENTNLTLLNVCVWIKPNGGMGTLYRSQHEFFLVWKVGTASHVNNVMLGASGRYRTNCWSAPGQNSFGGERDEALEAHPTVKPVSLVAEAIRDVSHPNDIVLDPFCGSGTILLAAERTHRRAYAIELDPIYVDVALRRYARRYTDQTVVLAATGETFAEVEARRTALGDFDEEILPETAWDIL